jgi:hypothetical protein
MPPCGDRRISSVAPYQKKASTPSALAAPTMGNITPRMRARARLASQVVVVGLSKRRRSRRSRAKLRTTRTPARLVCRTALSLPSACWLARVRVNICREGAGATIMNGIITSDDQGQPPLTPPSPAARSEGEDDVDDVEDAEAEREAHLLQVAGRAAHDLARRHRPIKRGAQAVEAVQEQRAQLVLGVPARVEDEPAARDAATNATRARPRMSEAGRVTWPGWGPKTASIADLDSQSIRLRASWKPASMPPPARYRGKWRRN